jgi:hypothetical protein
VAIGVRKDSVCEASELFDTGDQVIGGRLIMPDYLISLSEIIGDEPFWIIEMGILQKILKWTKRGLLTIAILAVGYFEFFI